jgi:drug/metabolite transporter (DMT)-like permease
MNSTTSSEPHPNRTRVLVAFAIVYVVWGSTYLAIRVAVETMPPFLFAGIRHLIAGGLLYAFLRLRGAARPRPIHWRNSAIVGTLLLLGGNGLVGWAEQTVSSGLAALIVCLSPVWFALFDWARPGGQRPLPTTWLGILIGFAGVTLLVTGRQGGLAHATITVTGLVALLVSCAAWAAGSVYSKYNEKPESAFLGAAMQMLCGSAALLLTAGLRGEFSRLEWAHFSGRSLFAVGYLIVFGSWCGFSAYVYLLKTVSSAKASTYAYVNPIIAVFLGWVLLGEPITTRILLGSLVIIAGVAIITLPKPSATKA